jgi:hypothetical protein
VWVECGTYYFINLTLFAFKNVDLFSAVDDKRQKAGACHTTGRRAGKINGTWMSGFSVPGDKRHMHFAPQVSLKTERRETQVI